MANNTTLASGGIGICGAVFIVFLILKLLGHITWSWWWVTAPLWIPTAVVVGLILVLALIFTIFR